MRLIIAIAASVTILLLLAVGGAYLAASRHDAAERGKLHK